MISVISTGRHLRSEQQSVLCLPRVVADERLVYFDHKKNRGSWVIRDFVAGQKLDDNHSALTGAQIEADALYDEFQFGATRRRIRLTGESYLNLRTTAVFRLRGPLRSPIGPNPQSGVWQAMEPLASVELVPTSRLRNADPSHGRKTPDDEIWPADALILPDGEGFTKRPRW